MYDELIKALRLCVKYNKATDALMNASQAADAIEDLSAFADTVKRLNAEGWFMQRHKADTCGYCIETRPLPKLPKEGDMST